MLGCHAPRATAAKTMGKAKIRVVFCETANNQPIWPNLGYDFTARREKLLATLNRGCPQLELPPAVIMDKPTQAEEVLKSEGEVDGYIVCVQGLGWNNDITKLCGTGKPTLLVDNLFGGSGLFLSRAPQILQAGQPVDWVSSSNDIHIVASARSFGLLAKGKSAHEVAAAFRATRRKNTPGVTNWTCHDDPVPTPDFEQALNRLRQTTILVVGGGWGGEDFIKAAQAVTGVRLLALDFKELAAAYEAADRQAAKAFAERWITQAQQVVEPAPEEIEKSGSMYWAMKGLIEKYGAHGISINCLGGFYGGHLKAYPCLGFSQLNDDGLVGGCEADQMSALTMTLMGILTGRPGYISDPVIDTAKNSIVYAHCVATTKPFGSRGARNAYRIRDHSEDRKGASIQSLLPAGYLTTTLEINPSTRQIVMHQAKTTGNNPSDMACRTKLEATLKGDLEKLTENWRMGWHRVTFYGDLKGCVTELSERLKLQIIEEA